MIDEKRVALMTRLAIYEKKEKNHDFLISKYFETDYVRYNVLKTWVASTVAYWLIVACYSFLHFDELLGKVNEIDYFDVMYKLLGGYVLFVFVYFVLATFVYHVRYVKAKSGLVEYNGNLRKLIELDEGGKGQVKSDTQLENVAPVAPVRKEQENKSRGSVNRMDMVNARLAQEQEAKKQEIIANVNRLNERREKERAAEEKRRRDIELEKERIRQRRQALERQQMERIRAEQSQTFTREDHTYGGDDNNRFGGND